MVVVDAGMRGSGRDQLSDPMMHLRLGWKFGPTRAGAVGAVEV